MDCIVGPIRGYVRDYLSYKCSMYFCGRSCLDKVFSMLRQYRPFLTGGQGIVLPDVVLPATDRTMYVLDSNTDLCTVT